MEFRHRAFDDLPHRQFYHTSSRFSYAPLPPPPPYYDSYFLPPSDTTYAPSPPSSDHCYFSTRYFRARMPDYRPRSEEPATGHNLFLPGRPRKDPFTEREYERERIREEILREEVRRRIIEEEVRWELEMDRYYGLRHPNLGYQGTWPAVQSEQSRYSYGCYTRGRRGQVPRKRFEARRWVREVPHRIVEIDEGELMSKPPASADKVKPPNKKKIQKKKKDEQTVQTKKGNKAERNVSEIPHQIMEATEGEIRQPQVLLKDKVQSPKNQEELRTKASLPEEALPEDKIKPPPNRKNIEKKGDGNKVLEPESGNKVEQLAFSKGSLREKALPTDKIKPPPNRKNIEKKGDGNKVLEPESGNKVEQLAFSKGSLREKALPTDKIMTPPSGKNIEKKGDGNKVLDPESGNKARQLAFSNSPLQEEALPTDKVMPPPSGKDIEKKGDVLKPTSENKVGQLAISQSSKELKEAEACGSKRKGNSISALPTTTSSSTDRVGLRKAKKQKIDKKEYNCTLCQVTVKGDNVWLGHLNGKRHRNTLKRLGSKVQMNKNGSSDMDKKSTSVIGLTAVKVEMDNADILATKPTGEELQSDKRIVKKMQVGHEVHEVVEKNNRLWCERCQYNCSSTVMMTIHLVSEKHKANSQKQ